MIDNITDFSGDYTMFARGVKKHDQWQRQADILGRAIDSEDITGYLRTVLREAKPSV